MEVNYNLSSVTTENFSNMNSTEIFRTRNWSATAIWQIIIIPLMIFTNMLVLFVLMVDEKISSFKIYLANLMVSNIVSVLTNTPMNVVMVLDDPYWRIGPAGCLVFVYSVYTAGALQTQAHLLIGMNRIWALWRPVHYR